MSNVPDAYRHIESLSASEIEARIQEFRKVDERSLTEEQLTMVVALHTIARRKTSGPPKTNTKKASDNLKTASLEDLAKGLGI